MTQVFFVNLKFMMKEVYFYLDYFSNFTALAFGKKVEFK